MTSEELNAFADKVGEAFLEGMRRAVPLPVEDLEITISPVDFEAKHVKFKRGEATPTTKR